MRLRDKGQLSGLARKPHVLMRSRDVRLRRLHVVTCTGGRQSRLSSPLIRRPPRLYGCGRHRGSGAQERGRGVKGKHGILSIYTAERVHPKSGEPEKDPGSETHSGSCRGSAFAGRLEIVGRGLRRPGSAMSGEAAPDGHLHSRPVARPAGSVASTIRKSQLEAVKSELKAGRVDTVRRIHATSLKPWRSASTPL